MTLKFARFWNKDYENEGIIQLNGKDFGYDEARKIIKAAANDPNGGGLKTIINEDEARVIKGPHRTPGGDNRLHMSVHCKKMNTIYHVYISQKGSMSGLSQEYVSGVGPKTGHAEDERNAPTISKVDDL